MKKLLKSKKGVSLMELIVGMMLFGMVALTVTAAISPLMMAYRRANDLAEYNQILDVIGNRVAGEMAKATSITTGTDTLTLVVDNVTVVYSLNSGHLQVQRGTAAATLVYQAEFYRGKTISFDFTGSVPADRTYFFNLTVTSTALSGTSGATLTRPYAVRPLLMT